MFEESCQGMIHDLSIYRFFVFVIKSQDVTTTIVQFFQIEAASKYSTVDTLKQQYRFVPAKHKV